MESEGESLYYSALFKDNRMNIYLAAALNFSEVLTYTCLFTRSSLPGYYDSITIPFPTDFHPTMQSVR
jgi:hypothetical protein